MSDAAVIATLRQKLHEKLSQQNIDLYTAQGVRSFNFALAVENLTQILFRFWQQNQRMPAIIFNDGLPASWKPTLDRDPQHINCLLSPLVWMRESNVPGEQDNVDAAQFSLFAFNCKMIANPGATVEFTRHYSGESGDTAEFAVEYLTGAYNSRFNWFDARTGQNFYVNIPRSSFMVGAFQTWGVLLVIAEHPEFAFASDEGIMLTMDGVAMVERSAAYWISTVFGAEFGGATVSDVYAHLGNGPVMLGVPNQLMERIHQMLIASERENQPFRVIATIVLTFVGFYFGVAGMSGLVAGAFTIPNLTASLSLAQRFGLDTGNLSSGLKIVGTLTGDMPILDTAGNTAGGAMDDLPGDWGVDPGSLDFGAIDMSGTLDVSGIDFSNEDFFAALDVDPMSIEFGDGWTVAQESLGDAMGDWGPSSDGYDAGGILREQEEALARFTQGPVSATQYAAAAGASPAATAAAQTAIRAAGGSPGSTQTSPQQIAAARQIADAQRQVSAGTSGATIWDTAGKILNLYGAYQAQQGKNTLATRLTYPGGNPGTMVRQPDGSISIRNADGTITTMRPNGQTLKTGANSLLPSFLGDNKTLLLIGGAAAIAALLLLMPSRGRR